MDPSLKIKELEKTVKTLQRENRSLRRQAEQADSANKAKSDFLTMISHEIRTPMNGVIGITELLLRTELDEKQTHFANLIHESARNLLILINSLLDFSKIEADKMTLDIEKFSMTELATELYKLYHVAGKQKGLLVRAEIDPRVNRLYQGDSYRIRQILVNLLGNAIKFTAKGLVILRVKVVESSFQGDMVRFEVVDSGPGIADEDLPSLFEPFSQVDNSTTRKYSGTGLGLSICKKLTNMMNGAIGVESELGMGSTFWVSLPLPYGSRKDIAGSRGKDDAAKFEEAEKNLGPVSADTCKILIVDDDQTNRMVMEEIFRKTGAFSLSVANGKEAVASCRDTEFDLVFMDCQMPVMDGFEATRTIRSLYKEKKGKKPVIVALTADATARTRQRCHEVGMDDHLVKPLDFNELQKVVDSWLPRADLVVQQPKPGLLHKDKATTDKPYPTDQVVSARTFKNLKRNVGHLGKIAEVFIRSLPFRLEQFHEAVGKEDFLSLQRIAHTLKGSCSQFGAEELAKLCSRLETLANEKQIKEIPAVLKKITDEGQKLADFLARELDLPQ